MKNKKGQYFLVAAIIIIIVLFSFAAVTNQFISKDSNSREYDLTKELNLESESVINYGIFNQKNLADLSNNFTKDYGNYIGEDYNVHFVYGNAQLINVTTYEMISIGTVSLEYGSGNTKINIETKELINQGIKNPGKGSVKIDIGGFSYPFELKEGQNFFIVIQEPK